MLKRITLHLARNPEFPNGSANHGYEIVAPLDDQGRLDAKAWREAPDTCEVVRFWAGEPDRVGRLSHRPGGSGGAHWALDYDEKRSDDDEPVHRLDAHRLVPGEYLSIRDQDEEIHTFKIIDVQDA